MATLGIDIGASKVRYAVLENEKNIAEGVYPNNPPTLEGLTEGFRKIKEDLQSNKISIAKIGVGVPGNPQNGTLAAARNFPKLVTFPLAKEIERIFGIAPAPLVNDAFAFTYAEAKLGAGKSFKRVVGITLGSGLGSGLVVGGQLYAKDDWPTLRQVILNARGGVDAEDRASEKFFKNKGLDTKKSALQAKEGKVEAQNIWREYGQNLGDFLADVVKILNPQTIILGGGIANDFELFSDEAKKRIKETKAPKIKILKSAFGPMSGAIGAALLAG